MKLRKNEFCPIHRSLFCCGREQTRKERRLRLGIQRIWSLSNAFTSAFKKLDPIPQFKATVKLREFLELRFSRSF